jgi:hypothetical protein
MVSMEDVFGGYGCMNLHPHLYLRNDKMILSQLKNILWMFSSRWDISWSIILFDVLTSYLSRIEKSTAENVFYIELLTYDYFTKRKEVHVIIIHPNQSKKNVVARWSSLLRALIYFSFNSRAHLVWMVLQSY